MGGTDVGNYREIGPGDFAEVFDFAGAVGAEFGDDEFVVCFGGEKGKRHADLVIEILGRLVNAVTAFQNVGDNVAGGGFADRAGNRDYFEF